MTTESTLIVAVERTSWLRPHRRAPIHAHHAVVYARNNGHTIVANGTATSKGRHLVPNRRTRYHVDIGDHRRLAELRHNPLPAKGDAHCFEACVDVGFRVTDPVEVVRRNITDGFPIVENHLAGLLRAITREFDIESSAEAEAAINQRLAQWHVLPEGIAIYACTVWLRPDGAARAYLGSMAEAERRYRVNGLEHQVAAEVARHEERIKGIAHDAELRRRRESLAALGGQPIDPYRLLMTHIADRPEDTQTVFDLLMRIWERALQREDIRDERALGMTRYLVDNGIIHGADIERFRAEATERIRGAAAAVPPAVPLLPGWRGAPVLPEMTLRPADDRSTPNGGRGTPANRDMEPGRASVALPVYLVVDESLVPASLLDQLDGALARLRTVLAGQSETAELIRLTILGFANTVEVRSRPGSARTDAGIGLVARSGTLYGPVFEWLLSKARDDVTRLKEDGATVHRPVVHFLAGTAPEDGTGWLSRHRQLVGPQNPCAPHIVACGVASAPAKVIAAVASGPGLGFVATDELDTARALSDYATFVTSSLVSSAQSLVAGVSEPFLQPPVGFRLAWIPEARR